VKLKGAPARRIIYIFIAASLWLELVLFFHYRDGLRHGYTDFSVFYTAGTILRHGLGNRIYDRQLQFKVQQSFTGPVPFRRGPLPFIHPPFEAIIFAPLTLLPYAPAFLLWGGLTALALLAVFMVLRRSVPTLQCVPPWKAFMVALAFYPVFVCFLQGQDSILQLLLCALAFHALQKRRDFVAGCWLGLAAFKFQFIVPMVVLFVLWRRARVAFGFAAVAAVLALLSLAIVGPGSLFHYPTMVLRLTESTGLGGTPLTLMPNLHGLMLGWSGISSEAWAVRACAIFAGAASAMVFLLAALAGRPRIGSRIGSRIGPRILPLQFSLAVVVAGLIAWQTNAHDLSLLVLPLVLMTDYLMSDDGAPPRSAGSFPRLGLLYPVVPLLIGPLWIVLWLNAGPVNAMAIPLLWWAWRIGTELKRQTCAVQSAPGSASA
jgi:hypothetical protein